MCPRFAWFASGIPKMANKVDKFGRGWPFLLAYRLFFL